MRALAELSVEDKDLSSQLLSHLKYKVKISVLSIKMRKKSILYTVWSLKRSQRENLLQSRLKKRRSFVAKGLAGSKVYLAVPPNWSKDQSSNLKQTFAGAFAEIQWGGK